MFLGLDMVLYIVGQLHYIYVTLSRLIVLYSRCRVNRGTNMFVVMYYVIYFCFASTAFWAPFVCALPNLWGAPHHDVHSVTMVSELWTQLPSSPPPPDFALPEPLPGGLQGWLQAQSDMRTCSALCCCEAHS